jgi:hypothetical protein
MQREINSKLLRDDIPGDMRFFNTSSESNPALRFSSVAGQT